MRTTPKGCLKPTHSRSSQLERCRDRTQGWAAVDWGGGPRSTGPVAAVRRTQSAQGRLRRHVMRRQRWWVALPLAMLAAAPAARGAEIPGGVRAFAANPRDSIDDAAALAATIDR